MVTEAALWAALEDVKDPEIPPVSVVDMGMVSRVAVEGEQVLVEMTPTFVGCPALDIIRRDVTRRLAQVSGVDAVEVRFVFDPPWTSERITPQGRERLKSFGIAPPTCGVMAGGLLSLEEVPPCPYCGSGDTHMENMFGPTACRAIYYCDSCRQPFEGMKNV
ncbi:MAG TPA: 1,2-phenylacetyl-CoA epoxidase subunit PaaD [Symbiobacteriaceae bacterium]|nr:1,2-phenylacetyl-CoA epoxidase subunit PaaD [Symbiobacteriaceae bacterium]